MLLCVTSVGQRLLGTLYLHCQNALQQPTALDDVSSKTGSTMFEILRSTAQCGYDSSGCTGCQHGPRGWRDLSSHGKEPKGDG
jgi:hypothetical protein